MIGTRGAASLVAVLALSSALAGCGGGQAPPDGGDARLDGSPDGTEGGGGSTIVVDTPSGVAATGSADGYCDIFEALAAAAAGQSVGDCANPKGVARVVLKPGNTYPVRRTLHVSGNVELGIADGATGSATITAASGFVVDARDPSSACLVSASDGTPDVWLRDVTLTQDPGLTLSGVCVVRGGLNLRRVHVTGFRAGGIVATCLPSSGCDHEMNIDQTTTLRLLGSLVDGNRSAGKGAGIASEGSGATVLVAHSAIVNNASDNDGGGVYLGGGWATDIIASSTISGNTTSGVGGGMLVRFAEATNTYVNVIGSTIANNTAAGTGGGIEFEPAAAGTQDVSVFSSIVAGNYSTGTLEWNINSGWSMPATPTSSPGLFNCVDGSFIYVVPGNPLPNDQGGCRVDVRNPFLGPLQPMGGDGNLPLHPLLAGSPAIDGAAGVSTRDEQRDAWINEIDPGPPADWMLFDPLVDGDGDGTAVRDLGAMERNARWQTELLAVRAQGPSAHTVVTTPSGYDRGAGTLYAATTNAANESVTYALPIAEAGRYDVTIGARTDADAGKLQIAIADDPAGPWTALGSEQDTYGAPPAFVTLGPFTTPLFTSPGEKLVRFLVTGRNASSAGSRLYLDFIQAKKSTAACPVADVAAGGSHTCALLPGGAVRCWGGNASGQLGDGSGANHASPPAVATVSAVDAVAAGASHTCTLANGTILCWGQNASGQLGDGSTAARATPPGIGIPLLGVKAISAGRAHTCALMNSGGVRCWGANGSGQLGDGSTTNRSSPPSIDVLSGVKAIAAGGAHTCALMDGGGVRCWGANSHGQLGDGTTDDRPTPPAADAAGGFAAVSAGDTHTCGLTTAGGVRCWGHNIDGELGIGTYDVVLSPPSTDVLTNVKQVVTGNMFTCALTNAGGVRCWGYNSNGEIGDYATLRAVDRLSPQTADILTGAASLSAGIAHVCARMTSGGVRCWGANDRGQLGDGMRPTLALTPPTMDIPGFTGTCN